MERSEWSRDERRRKRSRRYLERRRSILGEKGEEVIDGTSVMVQPSISRTYTFIIYYPCRYGYFASGTSYFSFPPNRRYSPVSVRRYARCIGEAQRPSSDEATFQLRIVHASIQHGTACTRVCEIVPRPSFRSYTSRYSWAENFVLLFSGLFDRYLISVQAKPIESVLYSSLNIRFSRNKRHRLAEIHWRREQVTNA